MIVGNKIGGGSTAKTYIIQTEDGRNIPAVLVENEVELTATANDIRLGKTAVTLNGVIEGEKIIPAYYISQGFRVIEPGSAVTLPNVYADVDSYDYTKLQCIICLFNSTLLNSVSAEKIALDDKVYNVKSTDVLSEITKDHATKTVNFGIKNNTDKPIILRFFSYKEVE